MKKTKRRKKVVKMLESNNKLSNFKKNRFIIGLCFIITISFITIGYAANFSSILTTKGIIGLDSNSNNLEIIEVSNISSLNVNSHTEKFSISDESTDDEKILLLNLNLEFYRTKGSSETYITYNVTIKNDSNVSRILTDYSSNYSFSGDEATYTYKIKGLKKGTTVIDPGESIEFAITFTLTDTTRATTYNITDNFKLNFRELTFDTFRLYTKLITDDVVFNSFNDLIPIEFEVTNKSNNDATYNINSGNDNFVLVNSNGSSLESFSILSNQIKTEKIYLKVSDNHFFNSVTDNLNVYIETTSPEILEYDVGNISVSIPQSKLFSIINNKTINDATTIDFLSTSTTSGIYSTKENDEDIYFYRGNVNNNYVSLANKLWRILRIDRNGIRVILNDSAGSSIWNSSKNVSNSGESGLEEAKEMLDYDNSTVKTSLDSWFNDNLASYKASGIIKTSEFCIDNSTVLLTGDQTSTPVYYFGSYKRIGSQSTNYTPIFNCTSQYSRKYDIGLISADEVAFAGGVFNTANSNYYLYWSTGTWWTISPSYYDSGDAMKTVNVFSIMSDGNLTDWPDSDLIAGTRYIRPIITINTERLNGGTGTSSDPYTFS